MDEEKEATVVETDEAKASSEATPAVATPSSQEKPKFTEEQETEVQKRVSDVLAKKGDKAKTLEETVAEQGKTIKTLQSDKLKVTAEKFGLTVEKLAEAGITDPEKVEAWALLFGKTKVDEPKDDAIPDSAKTVGGGEVPESAKGKMQAGWAELHK